MNYVVFIVNKKKSCKWLNHPFPYDTRFTVLSCLSRSVTTSLSHLMLFQFMDVISTRDVVILGSGFKCLSQIANYLADVFTGGVGKNGSTVAVIKFSLQVLKISFGQCVKLVHCLTKMCAHVSNKTV